MDAPHDQRREPRSPIPVLARSLLAVLITALLLVAFTPASGEGFTRGYNLLALFFITSAAVWLLCLLLMAALGWRAWRQRTPQALWPQQRFALACLLAGVLYPPACALLLWLKA